jgi:RES domain-containing protein
MILNTIPQLWQAPYGISSMGRFNPIGINYLYMADSLQTASAELKQAGKFTVMETSIKDNISILDLSDEECIIFELCNKRKAGSSANPQEYLLPNFIAQCCTYLTDLEGKKIEGLKYKSTLFEEGYDYVFFNKYQDSFTNEKVVNL